MKTYSFCQTAKRACPWAYLIICIICLAVVLGGCQSKGPSLSREAQVVKKELLAEMNKLTTALTEPVAKQDWEAVGTILQTSSAEMKKSGQVVPAILVVLDQNGITQGRFPPRKVGQMDFMNYEPTQIVFNEKRKTQAMVYLGGSKVFVFLAPVLKNDQVIGAVAMGFPEEELQRWKVSENEFLGIDFNQ
jgi:hypothetical protein